MQTLSLNQIQELFNGQGVIFWLAVTAVAVGLTLLSVSIIYQVRKILTQFKWPKRAIKAPAESISSPVPSQIQVTESATGYEARGFVPSPIVPATQATANDPILAQLLKRLQSSAARLEKIHSSLDTASFAPNEAFESVLKVSSEDVDYLYKSERS
ncbi:MAG: hypothetical protein ACI9UK_000165 [Candidatus Krumholzibacteriia bacterium]